jgi:ABC-type uncharacterized transport system permease subunit
MDSNKRIRLIVDIARLALTILVSCGLVVLIVLGTSKDPMSAFSSFFIGPFTSLRRIGNIIEAAAPLMFTALAVIMIFGAGQFSMITEGAFFIGTLGAMMIATSCPLPAGIHPFVALLVAGTMGAIVALIPALLKMKWKVSEVVTSLMLNYVVQFFAIYMVSYFFREISSSSLASIAFLDTSILPVIINGTRIHFGVVIAIVLCVVTYLLLYRTTFGMKLRITGDNAKFANYSGIRVTKIMVLAQVIAGAIAGIGGGVELLGMYTRFKWTSTPGYGWTGIAVALLARNNPLLVPVAALFMGYLNIGANIMARNSDVSSEVVEIIQGVMILMIAAEALLNRWRQKMIVKAAKAESAVKGDEANA